MSLIDSKEDPITQILKTASCNLKSLLMSLTRELNT
jgi:hypothetical protein